MYEEELDLEELKLIDALTKDIDQEVDETMNEFIDDELIYASFVTENCNADEYVEDENLNTDEEEFMNNEIILMNKDSSEFIEPTIELKVGQQTFKF